MEQSREKTPVENPYRHDHNPLNADSHGGICSACEWERDEGGRSEKTPTSPVDRTPDGGGHELS